VNSPKEVNEITAIEDESVPRVETTCDTLREAKEDYSLCGLRPGHLQVELVLSIPVMN